MENYQRCSMEELAQIITNHLVDKGIEVVLVGGLAVALYTDNRYLTKDIDLVDISYQSPKTLRAAMSEIGFKKKGRYYTNPTTKIEVEFPSGPLGVGDELVRESTVIKTSYGNIPVLHVIDVVKDRLSSYFHWTDQQALVQALGVMLSHKINPEKIKDFCENEGTMTAFEEIRGLYGNLKEQGILEMQTIENFIVSERLKNL